MHEPALRAAPAEGDLPERGAAGGLTGYAGRHAIFEILTMNDALIARSPSTEIHKRAVEQGMQTLRQSGWQCVLEGTTTVEDILRATPGRGD